MSRSLKEGGRGRGACLKAPSSCGSGIGTCPHFRTDPSGRYVWRGLVQLQVDGDRLGRPVSNQLNRFLVGDVRGVGLAVLAAMGRRRR